MARAKFPKGEQRFFLDSVASYFKNNWAEIAQILGINERTLRDWRRERYTMNHASLKRLHSLTKIPIPQGIKILENYWSAKKYTRVGALKRFQIYGSPATPEGRRKGGLATQRLIRMNPERALQLGIVVRKTIHDPGYSLDLAEFIGIMLGDGGVTNYQINITLNSQTDKEYLVYVKNLIEKLFHIRASVLLRKKEIAARIFTPLESPVFQHGVKYPEFTRGIKPRVNFLTEFTSGRNLVELVQKYGLKVGNKVRQSVDIPRWILDKNEYSISCLRGLMDTDGSCYAYVHNVNKKQYHNLALCFTNASQALLKSVYNIFYTNGYHLCITGRRVYVYSEANIAKYFQKIGSHNSKHLEKYHRFVDCKNC